MVRCIFEITLCFYHINCAKYSLRTICLFVIMSVNLSDYENALYNIILSPTGSEDCYHPHDYRLFEQMVVMAAILMVTPNKVAFSKSLSPMQKQVLNLRGFYCILQNNNK